jgi:hypothetical protein
MPYKERQKDPLFWFWRSGEEYDRGLRCYWEGKCCECDHDAKNEGKWCGCKGCKLYKCLSCTVASEDKNKLCSSLIKFKIDEITYSPR